MPLVKARPLLVCTVPDFWWYILASGLFTLVYNVPFWWMVQYLGRWCRFWMGALRRRLFCLVVWIGTLAPEMCILQYELAIVMPWKEEMMPSGRGSWKGSQLFQLKCWPRAHLCCGRTQSLSHLCCPWLGAWLNVPCLCLIFGIERWKRLGSPFMHQFS